MRGVTGDGPASEGRAPGGVLLAGPEAAGVERRRLRAAVSCLEKALPLLQRSEELMSISATHVWLGTALLAPWIGGFALVYASLVNGLHRSGASCFTIKS